MVAEFLSIALLVAILAVAVLRPRRLPEAVVAVPAALLVWGLGLVSTTAVDAELERLWPVLAFLAAVLVLAELCAAEGMFEAAGHWLARSSRGSPRRLLVKVFVLSAAVTSVLSLDATVVLLTPTVLATAARLRIPARPHVYATGRLANSASLLLPMGNLTNLLALAASGLTLVHFAAAMVVPWVGVLMVEYLVLRWYFRADLVETTTTGTPDEVEVPWVAVSVVALTLAGFVATSFVSVEPFWVAVAGAVLLGLHAMTRRQLAPVEVLRAVDVPFLCFVLGLTVVVRAVVDNGLGDAIDSRLPSGDGLVALLVLATIGAVLANIVNNLPALLILLAPAAAISPLAILAVLIGVNVGPNLTYVGSLATLLWRKVLRSRGLEPSLLRFTLLGLLTVPICLVVAVVSLWAVARVWSFV